MNDIFNQNEQTLIKVIELFIDDVSFGEYKVSVVDKPAIEKNFLRFNSERKKLYFSDEEKRLVVGPVLIPEKRIYRFNDGEEYYVFFSADTIAEIAHKFVKDNKVLSFNIEHSLDTPDVQMVESWIGRTPNELGMGLPEGTWYIACKVEDDELWGLIRDGRFNGFSLEGTFGFVDDDTVLVDGLDSTIDEVERFLAGE